MIEKVMSLDVLANHMRNLGEQLVPYNYPQADPKLEDDLSSLKSKYVMIDGYNIVIHYTKGDFKTHFLESLQIYGVNTPFLPFNLVVKLARKFLGSHDLSLVEILRENKKIYLWTVAVNRRGCPISSPPQDNCKDCVYEGFHYRYCDPSSIKLY